jgi:hypothetical protein
MRKDLDKLIAAILPEFLVASDEVDAGPLAREVWFRSDHRGDLAQVVARVGRVAEKLGLALRPDPLK